MGFPKKYILVGSDSFHLNSLWLNNYVEMCYVYSSLYAVRKFIKEDISDITTVEFYFCNLSSSVNFIHNQTIHCFTVLHYVRDFTKTIPCHTPFEDQTNESFVIVVDATNYSSPSIIGYVDLTKNSKYALLKDEDGKFQINLEDVCTDWQPFLKFFS